MKPKNKESSTDVDLDLPPKTRKRREKKKGPIAYYTIELNCDSDFLMIYAKKVTRNDEQGIVADGVKIEIYDSSFGAITPVHVVAKPEAGQRLSYQSFFVTYIGPYMNGKYHIVKNAEGMTFKVLLSELTCT